MEHASTSTQLAAGAALSMHVEPLMAGEQLVEDVAGSVEPGSIDLAVLFASGRHVNDFASLAEYIGQTLSPGTLIGVSAEGIIGGDAEVERRSGVALFVASMPGTRIHPFHYRELPYVKDDDETGFAEFSEALGVAPDSRAAFFFADPFSVPAASVVEAMSRIRPGGPGRPPLPIVGGMASASPAPGGNVLLLNGQTSRAGGIGLTISGDVQIDTVVSQGCRPIGKPHVVTECSRNIIKAIGGRRAMDVLHETVTALSPGDRALLPNGVFLGRVINEYKPRFGRGDFLIRHLMGIDQASGALAVSDMVRKGQTVQFHLRDARTASEDLSLLLDAQAVRGPSAGALLFTCNGRGSRLFEKPGHDAGLVRHTLRTPSGTPTPLAGMFAAGEIGPIGGRSFIHGHTACLTILRRRSPLADTL